MLKIGQSIIHFDQLPSTNAYALELLSEERPSEGTIITTDNQYRGKGQMSNTWESEPYKNVALSVVLYPQWLNVVDQWSLSAAISLAVFHTIDAYVPNRVKIKWPNDIYIDDLKVAGILIQNQILGSRLSSSIVGIGINVNQETFVSDAPNPTSLLNQTQQHQDITSLIETLCENLTQQYHALRLGAFRQIESQYHDLLYRLGEVSSFRLSDGEGFVATIKGVTSKGQLRLSVEHEEHYFAMKEVSLVL